MEKLLRPFSAVDLIPATAVLVLAPHPDDEIFGCGGAIAAFVDRGVPVQVVVLTNGALHGQDTVRQEECLAAACIMGYGTPVFLDRPDGQLYAADDDVLRRLQGLVETHKIDLVLAPSPWEHHPDHRQTFLMVRRLWQASARPLDFCFYEVGCPLSPNVLLDITRYLGRKQQAMACFASQLAHQNYAEKIAGLNAYRSYTLDSTVKAAEAFVYVGRTFAASFFDSPALNLVSWGMAHAPLALAPGQHPLVSVIVRSTDRPFLARALDSIATQLWPHIEVLVVSAVPGHAPVPDRVGAVSVRLISTDAPLGRSEAANRGLAAATGDFINFLDDDDWLMPDHVSRLASLLASSRDVDIVYADIALCDGEGRPLGQTFENSFDFSRLQCGNLTPVHAVMFRRSLLDRGVQFDVGLDLYEDWDFWRQLAAVAPFVHLPGVTGVYRVHNSSGIHQASADNASAFEAVVDKWLRKDMHQVPELFRRIWHYNDIERENIALRSNVQSQQHELKAVHTALQGSQASVALLTQQNEDAWALISRIEPQWRDRHQALEAHNAALEAYNCALTAQLRETESQLALVTGSKSWRYTSALRSLANALRQALRGSPSGARDLSSVATVLPPAGQAIAQGVFHPTDRQAYNQWLAMAAAQQRLAPDELEQRASQWSLRPRISIIMPVYNPPLDFLQAAIASIQAQSYADWELCVADDASTDPGVWPCLQGFADQDARIKVCRRASNGHISAASNSAVEMASGEFMALMDNDDLLHPDALFWVVDTVNAHPQADILYSDEDKINAKLEHFDPYFKPDWNYTLFTSHNLISHLGVYRSRVLRAVGGFRAGFEGSQDYDLALRCVEVCASANIVHIPRVLYHWRAIEGSTALTIEAKPYALEAAQRALQEHRARLQRPLPVEVLPTLNYNFDYRRGGVMPKTSIILVRTQASNVLHAFLSRQLDREVFDLRVSEPDCRAFNEAVELARHDIVLTLNNCIEKVAPADLMLLARIAHDARPALVAGRVLDAAGQVLSGGYFLNPETVAATAFEGLPSGEPGYMGRALLKQEFSAVNLFFSAMTKSSFLAAGGLNEGLDLDGAAALDLCLRLGAAGVPSIWHPVVTCTSGRSDLYTVPAAQKDHFVRHFALQLAHDRAYHPLLRHDPPDFCIALA